jgi:molybdate transport system substrate-binding protein
MKKIEVFGPGCKRCEATAALIAERAKALGVAVEISKVTDYAEIARAGVVATPGVAVDGTLEDLARAVRDGRLRRFAIADPTHAPYGDRARQVLRTKGIWEAIRPLLVYGENVAQAAQFATSGNAQGGIVALSLALSPELRARADHAPIAAEWHEPLRQRMVRLRGAGPAADRFFAHLQSEEARTVLRRYGFLLPGEAVTE